MKFDYAKISLLGFDFFGASVIWGVIVHLFQFFCLKNIISNHIVMGNMSVWRGRVD